MAKNISINLLKHISPSAFLEKYWGKQALFLQDAIDISGAELSKDVVFGLAKNENIESKVIAFIGGSQQTTYGPFNKVKHGKSSSLKKLLFFFQLGTPACAYLCLIQCLMVSLHLKHS